METKKIEHPEKIEHPYCDVTGVRNGRKIKTTEEMIEMAKRCRENAIAEGREPVIIEWQNPPSAGFLLISD